MTEQDIADALDVCATDSRITGTGAPRFDTAYVEGVATALTPIAFFETPRGKPGDTVSVPAVISPPHHRSVAPR